MSEPLPLAAAAARLRGKAGRPKLSDEEKRRRAEKRRATHDARLAAIAPRLFDVEGAARYTSFSPWTIRDLIAAGKVARVAIANLRAIRIAREDLDRLIDGAKT